MGKDDGTLDATFEGGSLPVTDGTSLCISLGLEDGFEVGLPLGNDVGT